MSLEHKLYGTQINYGYIWWQKKENENFQKVIPRKNFVLYFGKDKIRECKVDWNRHRFSIGPSVMKNYFKKGEQVIISNPSGNKVVICKK